MKKIMVLLVAANLAGGVMADMSVEVKNANGTVWVDAARSTFVDQAVVQLVWNATDPATAGMVDASLMAPGDIILSQFTTTSGYAGTWSDLGNQGGNYADTDVGGVNILNGYLTVRFFDNVAKAEGDKYLQYDIDVSGTLTEFDPLTPTTAYSTDGKVGSDAPSGIADFESSSYTIASVPEPATFGMMAVAGLGLFLARKKAHR